MNATKETGARGEAIARELDRLAGIRGSNSMGAKGGVERQAATMIRELMAALERDRTTVAETINALHSEIAGRQWMLEGRGPYAWDDDRYRDEFAAALAAIKGPIEKLRDIARDWSNCPTDPAAIQAARKGTESGDRAATNAAMIKCVGIVADLRNEKEPGPIFAALNEAVGRIEAARFAMLRADPAPKAAPDPVLDADGFTVWKGGDRPVPVDDIVAVKVLGNIPRVPVRAGDWPQVCWRHREDSDPMSRWNIVAFKVVGFGA